MDAKLDNGFAADLIHAPKAWSTPKKYLDHLIGNPWYSSIYNLLAATSEATHSFFLNYGARAALVPITTGSISSPMGLGSDSLPVKIMMSGEPSYLADSMQFYLELALRIDNRPSYYMMTSFRGEESDERHLNQFYHAEVEIVGGQKDIRDLAERYTRALASALLESSGDIIRKLAGTTTHVEKFLGRSGAFPLLSFEDAIAELGHNDSFFEQCDTGDLKITRHGERELIRRFGDFVWLSDMPTSTVPFYQAVKPSDHTRSLTGDLLAGIGEVLGSGERARTANDVRKNMEAARVAEDGYEWYLAMKDRAPLQTAGFGMGIERFLMWVTQTQDIRDWSLIPRNAFGQGPL